jgi:drug/metabolite transporter (DMT)-like permease
MEPPVWGVLAGISALNLAMAFLLLHVYQHAAPPRLGPFSYSYLVFAAALDWAVWGAPPTATTLLGAGLTAAAGMLVLSARAGGARARGEPAE